MKTKQLSIKTALLVVLLSSNFILNAWAVWDKNVDQKSPKIPEFVSDEVLVGLKEDAKIEDVIKAADLSVSPKRTFDVQPAVEKFKKENKFSKDTVGRYEFGGKKYKDLNAIPPDDLFQEAYKGMPSNEKKLYRGYKLKLPKGKKVEDAVAKLKKSANVEYAEPNYIATTFYTPNDPLYPQQWAHQKTHAESGWDIMRGNPSVVIAVVDTGVDYGHEDLRDNIWRDPVLNTPGKDFVDIVTGDYTSNPAYTLVDGEDYTDIDDDPKDFNGHGTHCAGIAGAKGGNSIGVAGVCHNCRIMPVRVGFSMRYFTRVYGFLESDDIANGIKYAVDHGANIISMSFGGPSGQTILDAIQYANLHNVILVAAAGNTGYINRFYPAVYDGVISVGATDSSDARASFSTYDLSVDVAAPGVSILSTALKTGAISDPSGYLAISGTSMACPYVAGLAGLVLSEHPDWSKTLVENAIKSGADVFGTDIPALPPYVYLGTGRVNVQKALQIDTSLNLQAEITSPQNIKFDINPFQSWPIDSVISIQGKAIGGHFTVSYGKGFYPTVWQEIASGTQVNGGELAKWNTTGLEPDIYSIRLQVSDSQGHSVNDKKMILLNIPTHSKFPLPTTGSVLADLDNDGKLDIIGSWANSIVATSANGDPLTGPDMHWPYVLPPPGEITSYLLVSDLDGDGFKEIVAADQEITGVYGSVTKSGFFILDNKGQLVRQVFYDDALYSFPVVGNVDDDITHQEIIVFHVMRNRTSKISVYNYQGSLIREWNTEYSQGTPILVDINHDGKYEIVVAAYPFSDVPQDTWIHVYSGTGTDVVPPLRLAKTYVLDIPYVVDIDGDGVLNVVFTTFNSLTYAYHLNVLELGPLGLSAKYPPFQFYPSAGLGGNLTSGISFANLDGVPGLEMVFTLTNTNRRPELFIMKADGVELKSTSFVLTDKEIFFQPSELALADTNKDGKPEMFFSARTTSGEGYVYVVSYNGAAYQSKKIIFLPYSSMGAPLIGDIDNDGIYEIAINSSNQVYSFIFPAYYVFKYGQSEAGSIPWPMWRVDPQLSGMYIPKFADLTITQFFVGNDVDLTHSTAKAGESLYLTATFENQGNAAAGAHSLKFYVDNQLVTGVVNCNVPSLAKGEMQTYVCGPWTATLGTHQVKAVIDADNQIVESNEGNNTSIKTLTVTDGTPPTVSNGAPAGTLAYNTLQVSMSVKTDENATCKYDLRSGIAYASMTNTFTTTGGTSHSQTIATKNGISYKYYVKCRDTALNANSTDYQVNFGVTGIALTSSFGTYAIGDMMAIKWSSVGVNTVSIKLMDFKGNTVVQNLATVPAVKGQYNWVVSNIDFNYDNIYTIQIADTVNPTIKVKSSKINFVPNWAY